MNYCKNIIYSFLMTTLLFAGSAYGSHLPTFLEAQLHTARTGSLTVKKHPQVIQQSTLSRTISLTGHGSVNTQRKHGGALSDLCKKLESTKIAAAAAPPAPPPKAKRPRSPAPAPPAKKIMEQRTKASSEALENVPMFDLL